MYLESKNSNGGDYGTASICFCGACIFGCGGACSNGCDMGCQGCMHGCEGCSGGCRHGAW